MSKQKIVLQRDVYDALELSVRAAGGIGGGCLALDGVPMCILGHAHFLDGLPDMALAYEVNQDTGPVARELLRAFTDSSELSVVASVNDRIFNRSFTKNPLKRITFAEWCDKLGVVRGDN